jgi:hypothetical protein
MTKVWMIMLLGLMLIGCSGQVENTAGHVFDNANSALNSSTAPIWVSPEKSKEKDK